MREYSYNMPWMHRPKKYLNTYEKKTSRFEFLQSKPTQKLTEQHVIKHVSVSFQSKILF